MIVKLASILSSEQERTQEIAEECNALKCSLEPVQNRNELLENEAKGKKQEVVESKQAYDLSKEQLEQEKKKYEKLAIELKEMKSTESRSKKELSGNLSFELELERQRRTRQGTGGGKEGSRNTQVSAVEATRTCILNRDSRTTPLKSNY